MRFERVFDAVGEEVFAEVYGREDPGRIVEWREIWIDRVLHERA